MQHVRSFEEGRERLAQTPEGREILELYVELIEVEAYIRNIRFVSPETRERVIRGLRRSAEGADVVPYYLMGFLLAELCGEDDETEVLLIDRHLKTHPSLKVHSTRGVTLH